MAKHRSHSLTFKRQVAQEFIAGETLHSLADRHDISRNLIPIWVAEYEAGEFDDDADAADMLQATKQGLLLSNAWWRYVQDRGRENDRAIIPFATLRPRGLQCDGPGTGGF